MRVKQLLELEHQTSALQRRGFAPSRKRGFRSGDGGGDFSCVCERHAGRHSALRRIEYLAKPPARASGALTVDEMTQLAHARGALICFAHMSSNGDAGAAAALSAAARATPPHAA